MPNLTLQEFLDYIRAFNTKDYENQHAFYAKDVTLTIPDPNVGTLYGSQGILNHYKPLHATADETVVPMVVMLDQNKIFFIMETYFRYKMKTNKAVHDYEVEEGDVVKVTVWAYYEIDQDKKMNKIVCNLFEGKLLGKVDVGEQVRDSQSRADPGLEL